ncbi:MAG: zinc-binding dehydrogenase, partial [Anaerolineales bacterium]|nr:zinc-binding dehydrogenase [Anaerolineales bacterium]
MADHVSFEEEALRDILGVAVHAAGRGALHEGATVLCIGGGPLGLCLAQVARARGAGRVFVSEPSALARSVIAQFTELTCVDPAEQRLAEALEGRTCAAVFDTVGTSDTMREGLGLLAESGSYVNLAVHDTPVTLNAAVVGSERTITTSSNACYQDEREAHELIGSGAVRVGPMITHRFRLADCPQAFDLLLAVPKEAYKVVLQPQ